MEVQQQQEKQVSRYAAQIAYDKKRKQDDPDYKAKKYQISSKSTMNRRKNDPEYRQKYNEYMREYLRKVRENHRQFLQLQQMQNLELKDKID
jgi:hypothetical protein